MADAEEIRWLRSTANDLNNLIQVISESSKALKPLCDQNMEATRYYSFLSSGLDRAQNVTAQMAARLGGLSESVVIPVEAPQTAAPAARGGSSSEAFIQNPTGTAELIMVIDDESVVLDLASAVLASEGYRVIAMKDVFQALSIYTEMKEKIALVILDFTMPIMDGSEVFDELKKISPAAAVMLSSGFAEQKKVHSMLVRGLRGFLPKPYTKQKLLSQVRSTLDAIRSERTGERRVL